jgi:hypothetical protein
MMKHRIAPALAIAAIVALAWSCDTVDPASTDGEIVLHFEPAATAMMRSPGAPAAALFDSVVVNVYRTGTPLRLEVSHGAAITSDDPIDVSVGCIAENGKKVGVDLYVNRVLVYHGSDSDVDVIAGRTTAVTIDVSAFYVSTLTLTPSIIPNGAAFTLHWPPAAAAATYRVEESATLDFAAIASTESVTDTTVDVHVAPGSHYFRVRPMTPYAKGPASLPRFGYVTDGTNQVQITGVDAAVIPGATITITGENLDFPGAQATIGARKLTLESMSWGQLVARVPKTATTEKVSVSSTLGSDTSNNEVVVQRVAYVTSTGEFAASYINLLAQHRDDFGQSGVVAIPVAQLDTRDMSVFDIIIVANDTGDSPARWAGKPARYAAITNSGAGVLAIGEGGTSFLRLAAGTISSVSVATTSLASYYTATPSSTIFTKPHSITSSILPQTITFCVQPEPTVSLSFGGSKPAGATDYADTAALSNKWVIAEFQVTGIRYLYFGYGSDPSGLTSEGQNFLGNAMNLLFGDRPPLPANVAATR